MWRRTLMKIKEIWGLHRNSVVVTACTIVLLLPLAYSAASAILIQPPDPFLELPDEKYQECVKETEYMRLHHMDLLKEIREEFVRYGNRGDIALSSCRGCHTSRQRFCDRCHNAVSLSLDCFGCHYYPEPDTAS